MGDEGARGSASPSTSSRSFSDDPPIFSTVLVYATSSRHYLVAGTRDKLSWRILNVSRFVNTDGSLDASEDPTEYSETQCARVLAAISAGNASSGGMSLVARGVAVVGTLRILNGHYICLVTQRIRLGQIRGHDVFGVGASELVRIAESKSVEHAPSSSNSSSPSTTANTSNPNLEASEKKLKKLLLWVDLSRGCFYSHTYGIAATLQSNALNVSSAEFSRRDFDSQFAWNAHLSKPLRLAIGEAPAARWVTPLVFGFFERRRVSLLGKELDITLIARRSRHFAGTRYRRRGVNAKGHVANEVETEQIIDVLDEALDDDVKNINKPPPRVSSAAQLRGSIPIFWSQEASVVAARPEIMLGNGRVHDSEHTATANHLDLVERRYGAPAIMLSLVRSCEKKRREEILRDALHDALETINANRQGIGRERIACVHWDFERHMRRGARVTEQVIETETDLSQPPPRETSTTIGLTRLARVAAGALELVGVFAVGHRVALEAAAARHERDARGEPAARAAAAWRAAACELVTGVDGADATTGACASASPWASSLGPPPWCATPSDIRQHVGVIKQTGVLRSHCIDCLDRTNVAQFAWGLAALGAQLEALGLADSGALPMESTLAGVLLTMYRGMGDSIAMQYGGSEAHAKVRGDDVGSSKSKDDDGSISFWKNAGKNLAASSAKVLTSAKRFYSNAYTDQDKQEGIDLWIGTHPATKTFRKDDEGSCLGRRENTNSNTGPPNVSSLNWTLLRGASGETHGCNDDDYSESNEGSENNTMSNLVSLDNVASRRLKATPVRLDGSSSRAAFVETGETRIGSPPMHGPLVSSLENGTCVDRVDSVDTCLDILSDLSSPVVSTEDASTYALFATGAVDDSFYFPATEQDGANSFPDGNEPDIDSKREWSETAAAAEYAAMTKAVAAAACV